MLERELRGVLQRTVDLDVGVQIQDAAAVIGEHVLKKARLDCGRKLCDIVDCRQAANFRSIETDVAQSNTFERLMGRIKLPGLVVDEQEDEPATGMMLEERTRQDPNVSNIVARGNGASSDHQPLTATSPAPGPVNSRLKLA